VVVIRDIEAIASRERGSSSDGNIAKSGIPNGAKARGVGCREPIGAVLEIDGEAAHHRLHGSGIEESIGAVIDDEVRAALAITRENECSAGKIGRACKGGRSV
jgi:hypothetical protein